MENEKCKFAGTSIYCQILVGVMCHGTDELCKFYKTEKQFQKERDRAIRINREKGNCEKCRYNKILCEVSVNCLKERRDEIENNPEY